MKVIPKEEVLSLEDGETRTLRIIAYMTEEVQFPEYTDPAWLRSIPPRQFRALRIEISHENEKLVRRHYWIDSKRLIFRLLPHLKSARGVPATYKIHKRGVPPDSRYRVWKL